jgi:hypothetical protein
MKMDIKFQFSDSVTKIGNGAFRYCSNLKNVTIPKSVISIGEYVFADCTGLEKVVVEDGTKSIDSFAFYNCSSLENIRIPDSVTDMDDFAFSDCYNLTIYCSWGSYADRYSITHMIPCSYTDTAGNIQ